jgi:hypothetical protein
MIKMMLLNIVGENIMGIAPKPKDKDRTLLTQQTQQRKSTPVALEK